ncbi:hypothetical protein MAM1_0136d06295 [Mucor ambiguus]|uniref:Uncharacterized protein n=1 Tax=Mucor ambiguus TaxID=91626 RepID=A0A0C9LVH9_9FUNG|nr:hypothetical protein MAM1_0136d06295 [Mucor ambiguus]
MYMPLKIAANVSFEGKNEVDAIDSKANDNGTVDAVESKVIDVSHAEQEATEDDVALPPTAKYSEVWIHLKPNLSR